MLAFLAKGTKVWEADNGVVPPDAAYRSSEGSKAGLEGLGHPVFGPIDALENEPIALKRVDDCSPSKHTGAGKVADASCSFGAEVEGEEAAAWLEFEEENAERSDLSSRSRDSGGWLNCRRRVRAEKDIKEGVLISKDQRMGEMIQSLH